MDVAERLPRLRARLPDAGLDALVVTSLTNVRYLTGFSGTAGMLLVGPDAAVLFTDGRYGTQSVEQVAAAGAVADVEVGRPSEQREALRRAVADFARLGLEAEHVSWASQASMADALACAGDGGTHPRGRPEDAGTRTGGPELVPTAGLVEGLRRVKDRGELARMQAAAAIADAALAEVVQLLVPGVTEVGLASALDHQMRRLGADDRSFETIVASGPHSAMPHARPTARQVGEGELVVVDFGAVVDGYCSDMTRTFCIGRPASQVLSAVVEVVAAAQAAGVAAVAVGVEAAAVDRACREVVAAAGWAERFVHGTGHGVGLDIHEAPSVGPASTDRLEESSVLTVEPGVYLAGQGGARIEDTVVVTGTACQVLTRAPKDLVPG